MQTPLRTEQPKRVIKPLVSQSGPTSTQFSHFGTLDTGKRSGIGPVTSIIGNCLAAFIIFVIWKAAPPVVKDKKVENVTFAEVKPVPPPPPPKLPPPPKFPPKPPVVPPTPKVVLPTVKIPDPPKVEVKVQPTPQPAVRPAPPKTQEAPPAPRVMPVSLAHAAAVPNHDAHPSAVSLGHPDNPIAVSNRPATATVNLGNAGMQGMPPGSGRGPNSTAVNLGSGRPNGTNLNGTGVRNVTGIPTGIQGGTGRPGGNGVGQQQAVALGRPPQPVAASTPTVQKVSASKPPTVLYQPKPQYTADAKQNNVEGSIRVRIRVSATGQVTVLGVVGGGLGHGLDQNALTAAQGIRFRPALDSGGNPTDWEGVVSVLFQLA